MSNHARRVLAFCVCVALGVVAGLEGVRRLSPGSGSSQLVAGALVLVSMFLLLSAVGLARPWLSIKPRR